MWQQHAVAIAPPLALFTSDQHALAVDIVDLKMGDPRNAQTRAISNAECGLVLDAGCCLEQPDSLLNAEDFALVRTACRDQSARQVTAPERDGVEEAQRRHRAVYGARAGSALVLVDLEIAQILCGCRIEWSAQVGCEAPDVPNDWSCVRGSRPHYVVLHARAQQADRGRSGDRSHREVLSFKGTSLWDGNLTQIKTSRYTLLSPRSPAAKAGSSKSAKPVGAVSGRSRAIVAVAISASARALRLVLPCEVGTLHS